MICIYAMSSSCGQPCVGLRAAFDLAAKGIFSGDLYMSDDRHYLYKQSFFDEA